MHQFLGRVIWIIARLIGSLLPAPEWYSATVRVSRLLAPVFRLIIRLTRFRNDPRKEISHSWLVGIILQRLDSLEKPFPIPIRTSGSEAIFQAWNRPEGVVVCSVHLPLWNLILRSLVELNCSPTLVLAGEKAIRDGMFPPWGSAVRLPALVVDKKIYIKARGILRRGGSVATMIDDGSSPSLNQNVLKFIGAVGARVVFATVELQGNGEVLVQFYTPPDPFCKTEQSVRSNIAYFESRIDAVLHRREHTPENEAEMSYSHPEEG